MSGRIDDKSEEIERYVDELSGLIPESLDTYLSDVKTKAACERYFEKIVEAMVDLAFLCIKERGLDAPEEDKQAFDILASAAVIKQGLATRLKEAKGMRNILAHEYGQVDDEIVFSAVTDEICKDAHEFVACVRKHF